MSVGCSDSSRFDMTITSHIPDFGSVLHSIPASAFCRHRPEMIPSTPFPAELLMVEVLPPNAVRVFPAKYEADEDDKEEATSGSMIRNEPACKHPINPPVKEITPHTD